MSPKVVDLFMKTLIVWAALIFGQPLRAERLATANSICGSRISHR